MYVEMPVTFVVLGMKKLCGNRGHGGAEFLYFYVQRRKMVMKYKLRMRKFPIKATIRLCAGDRGSVRDKRSSEAEPVRNSAFGPKSILRKISKIRYGSQK